MGDSIIERERYSQRSLRAEEVPSRTQRRRRQTRKPRRILGLWGRLTLLGLAVIVLVMAAVGLVAKVVRPYREAAASSRQLARTRSQVAMLDAQNTELRRRVALLNTPGGIVTEARMMGYLKPGEIPFVVESVGPQDKPAGVTQIISPAPSLPKPHSHWRGLLHRLTGR